MSRKPKSAPMLQYEVKSKITQEHPEKGYFVVRQEHWVHPTKGPRFRRKSGGWIKDISEIS